MNQLRIDQIVELAKRKDHPFGNYLLTELKGLILSRGYSDLDANIIAGTYSTRYHINQTITHVETIQGWLPLVPNLKKLAESKDALVRLIPIETEQNEYLHFVSPQMDTIYGVLQLAHIKLDRTKELNDTGNLRSSWGDCVFYDNCVEIKTAHNTA